MTESPPITTRISPSCCGGIHGYADRMGVENVFSAQQGSDMALVWFRHRNHRYEFQLTSSAAERLRDHLSAWIDEQSHEEDEDPEVIRSIFDDGEKGVTEDPRRNPWKRPDDPWPIVWCVSCQYWRPADVSTIAGGTHGCPPVDGKYICYANGVSPPWREDGWSAHLARLRA